jgi:hypothetical protein
MARILIAAVAVADVKKVEGKVQVSFSEDYEVSGATTVRERRVGASLAQNITERLQAAFDSSSARSLEEYAEAVDVAMVN